VLNDGVSPDIRLRIGELACLPGEVLRGLVRQLRGVVGRRGVTVVAEWRAGFLVAGGLGVG
jgi:hypothetical protein